jgi:ubiquitin-protein ligase
MTYAKKGTLARPNSELHVANIWHRIARFPLHHPHKFRAIQGHLLSQAYYTFVTTMTPTKKRLEKEFHGLRTSAGVHEGYSVQLKNGEIFEWTGSIHGLENSPYEGGTFAFHMQFTDDYPEEPPKIHFTTKIYHPNVTGRTGAISWNMIGSEWHRNDTVEKVLIGLRRLLERPELESAVEIDIANEYANQRDMFERKARIWTTKTAHEGSS